MGKGTKQMRFPQAPDGKSPNLVLFRKGLRDNVLVRQGKIIQAFWPAYPEYHLSMGNRLYKKKPTENRAEPLHMDGKLHTAKAKPKPRSICSFLRLRAIHLSTGRLST